MSRIPLDRQEKRNRLVKFLTNLNDLINNSQKISFGTLIRAHQVVWNANAWNIRSILLDMKVIQPIGGSRYQFTDYSSDIKFNELVSTLIERIDDSNSIKNDNKHKYPRVNWSKQQGDEVFVHCFKCGLKKRVRRNGQQTYYNYKGSTTNLAVPCQPVVETTSNKQPEPQKESAPVITLPTEAVTQTTPATIKYSGSDTQLEARLQEVLVMLNLAYEDMVIFGVRSHARNVLGRFLYSNGYEELKKYIDASRS